MLLVLMFMLSSRFVLPIDWLVILWCALFSIHLFTHSVDNADIHGVVIRLDTEDICLHINSAVVNTRLLPVISSILLEIPTMMKSIRCLWRFVDSDSLKHQHDVSRRCVLSLLPALHAVCNKQPLCRKATALIEEIKSLSLFCNVRRLTEESKSLCYHLYCQYVIRFWRQSKAKEEEEDEKKKKIRPC